MQEIKTLDLKGGEAYISDVSADYLVAKMFLERVEENYYMVGSEQMDLDKDILVKGNKVYSPFLILLILFC